MFEVDGTVKTRFNGGNKWYKGTRSKKPEVTGGMVSFTRMETPRTSCEETSDSQEERRRKEYT